MVFTMRPDRPASSSFTERLLACELVYTGVERTPLAAVVSRLPWRAGQCPLAAELFATTADAYLLLGDLPEEPTNLDTADGRPRTRSAAHARIARMFCADAKMVAVAAAPDAAHESRVRNSLARRRSKIRARSRRP